MRIIIHKSNVHSGNTRKIAGGARGTIGSIRRWHLQEIYKMIIQSTHTLAELQSMANEQGLSIEEKYGRYRVISNHAIRDLSVKWRVVEAGAGYTLTLKGLYNFFSLS